tara:strand:+ start:225 stop:740 length:516 start_codon:yes stop_codon:yes gene_type:complete
MSRDLNIEERVARIEDRLAIEDLVSSYGRAVDDRDYETLAQMYCSEAKFDSVEGLATGREAVISYYKKRTEGFGPTYHYPHSVEIFFLDDKEARGLVCAHAELSIDGQAFWVALRYEDIYRWEDGKWRFFERVVKLLYSMLLSELPENMGESLRKRWPGTEPASADWGNFS